MGSVFTPSPPRKAFSLCNFCTATNKRKVFDLTKYVLKRLVYVVIVFLIVSFLMFCLFGLMQGDAARAQLEGARLTMKPDAYEAAYQALREELGLNENLLVRYARWMGFMVEKKSGEFNGILQGNLGYSQQFGRYCADVIKAPIVNTMIFNIFATILTLGITIPLGIWCAVHRNSKLDQGVQAFTIIGYSIPQYIIGLLFIFVFAVLLRWFPVNGAATPGSNYTGMREFADRMYYLTLPIIVSTFSGLDLNHYFLGFKISCHCFCRFQYLLRLLFLTCFLKLQIIQIFAGGFIFFDSRSSIHKGIICQIIDICI